MKVQVTDTNVRIHHDLRSDSGRQIEWIAADGSTRIPEEQDRIFVYPGSFTAAGKVYPDLQSLCIEWDEVGCFCRDIYGREVFCVSERFPCFDSYDYLYEKRCYRWFFIKENGSLTRVYYSDGRNQIRVTEDVRDLENKCREKMEAQGWLK